MRGVDGVGRDDALEGRRRGLRREGGRADVEDVLEQAGEAEGLDHPLGVDGVGIGEDQPPAGQPAQSRRQGRRRAQAVERHVVEDVA